jgi:hypothetical protein
MMAAKVEWDDRQLCSDGGCVGVIGPDGVCKACGKPAPNFAEARKRAKDAAADDDVDADDAADDVDESAGQMVPSHVALDNTAEAPDDFEQRTLCVDGSCVGVLGDDGKCRVCGKAGVAE